MAINYLFIFLLISCNLTTIYFIKRLVTKMGDKLSLSFIYDAFFYVEFYLLLFFGAAAVFLFMFITSRMDLSKFSPILTGLLTLLVSAMGIILFKESLTANKIFGLTSIIIGIIFLSK